MGKQNIQAENVYCQETLWVSRYNVTVQTNRASQRKKFFIRLLAPISFDVFSAT